MRSRNGPPGHLHASSIPAPIPACLCDDTRGRHGRPNRWQRRDRPCARIPLIPTLTQRHHRRAMAAANRAAKPDSRPFDDRFKLLQASRAIVITELGGSLQAQHFRRESPCGSRPFSRSQRDGDRFRHCALARSHPRPGQALLVVERPKSALHLVERGKRGRCLLSRTTYRQRSRMRNAIAVSPAAGM